MKTSTKIIIIIFFLLLAAGGAYWYLFFYGPGNEIEPVVSGGTTGGFIPLNSPSGGGTVNTNPNSTTTDNTDPDPLTGTSTTPISENPIPYLRLLSNTPVGGYGASTTASTTVVRWIDRGRGNVLETKGDSLERNQRHKFFRKIFW
jgi:hypothetical protein